MGNTEVKQKEGQIEYERLGPVTVEEIKGAEEDDQKTSIMKFSRAIESETVYKNWVKQIEQMQGEEMNEVLLLPHSHSFQKAGMCGSSGFVDLAYDNFPFVLDSEILNRKKLTKYFLETEMWYLLYNMIRASQKFEKEKRKIGDISPHNILINDDGQIKILSEISLPNELNNFQKFVQGNTNVYLAPEELESQAHTKGEYPNDIDPCKAEVFSLGLTILSSGILENCQGIYHSNGVNENKLNNYLTTFKSKYSNYLFTTVCSMLALNPKERRRSSDIYNELSPHEDQILDLEEFVVERNNSRPVSHLPPGVHPYHQPSHYQQSYPSYYQQPAVQQVRR